MYFEDIVGQEDLIKQLSELVKHNRLSHAILLTGKPGCGLLPLAIGFGQLVVSKTHSPADNHPAKESLDLFGLPLLQTPDYESQPDPMARALQHPDLHFSFPTVTTKGTKPISADFITEFRAFYATNPYGSVFDWLQFINAENKQGNITAEECQDILRKLSLKTFKSSYKVLVMWLPEYLGKNGNRLLKLIEEPPDDTLFILASENENAILKTLVSRCQHIRVPPIQDEAVAQYLVQKKGLEKTQARQLALICEGNLTEAIQLLEHADEDLHELLKTWLNACLVTSGANNPFDMRTSVVEQLSKLGRERQKQLLRYFMQLIEQSIRLRLLNEQLLNLPAEEKDFATRINRIAGLGQQQALAEEIGRSIYYIERNAHAKMLFMALSLKIRKIIIEKTALIPA